MHLIAALGNPGNNYASTRHNAGRIVLDMILEKLGLTAERKFEKKRQAEIWQTNLKLEKLAAPYPVLFVKPQTYMNLSGESIQPIMNFYKISPNNLLVLSDDLDQAFGALKYKPKGSSGGQNGIKSIINKIGTQEFFRLKIGIGRPENGKHEVIDRVLSKFSEEELQYLYNLTPQLIHHLGLFLQGKS